MTGVTPITRGSMPSRRALARAVVAIIGVNVIGAAPAIISSPDSPWFRALEKPWYYPPEIAFGIVWTLLFTLMGIAVWLIWERRKHPGATLALGLFGVQMAFNVVWSPAFFTLQRPLLALGIIVVLWGLIVATIAAFRRVDRRSALLLVPYLLWVTFATVLNYELWRLNA